MYKLKLIILFCFILSCSRGKNSNTVQYHPMEERIPYHSAGASRTYIDVDINAVKSNSNQSILSSSSFLNYFELSEPVEIPVFLPDFSRMTVLSIDENRLLILSSQSYLHEYNIESQTWTEIAAEGRGPGDLMYATDISIDNKTVYISAQDYKIHVFNCDDEPCTYDSTIPIKNLRPNSLISTSGEITIMAPASGYPTGGLKSDSLSSLHTISKEGDIINSFGEMYDVRGMWILNMNLNSGKILAIHTPDYSLLQYYMMMPNLYVFSKEKKLSKTFSFKNFTQGYTRLNTKSMTSYSPDSPWTFIDKVINSWDSKIIVRLQQILDPLTMDDRAFDFYLIDLLTNDHSFIGRESNANEKIWFTDHHLLTKNGGSWKIYSYTIKE